ncbi:MAG TPA: arginase family protein [Bacilli bacterium]|nr:arginase family protein [Bacilli bacterium]
MHIQLLGIPSWAGGEYSGTELAPKHLRAAGLIPTLAEKGIRLNDLGDLPLPEAQPRHNIPPIRHWPAPRMIWGALTQAGDNFFQHTDDTFTLLLGGDCSLIVGSVDALHRQHGDDLYVLVVDGHVDTYQPKADNCVGAAAMGLYFLLSDTQWWPKPQGFDASHVKVIGHHEEPEDGLGIESIDYNRLRRQGIVETLRQTLSDLPDRAKILVHFDIDVMHKGDMPAAYEPSQVGLFLSEAQQTMSTLLADRRVIALELTEFSALRDPDQTCAKALNTLLAEAFAARMATNKIDNIS